MGTPSLESQWLDRKIRGAGHVCLESVSCTLSPEIWSLFLYPTCTKWMTTWMDNLPVFQCNTELQPCYRFEADTKGQTCEPVLHHRMQMSPHEVTLPAHQSRLCQFNGLVCSSRKSVHGNKGKHSSRKDGRGQSKWGVSKDVMERYVDCKGGKKISLSLLSSVDNQSFLSALE